MLRPLLASRWLLGTEYYLNFFFCGMIGVLTAFAFVLITQYYTEYRYRPVKWIAESCKTGPATTIIAGLSVGMECTAIPILVIGSALIGQAFSDPAKPDWIRVRAPNTRGYADTRNIVRVNGLVTVCEEAGCPNIGECWDKKHATFMIMGDTCTRACAFCNVKTGLPGALDATEPAHVGEATAKLGLSHIVVTSVDRDDLVDGGAQHFAEGTEQRACAL